MVGWDWRGRWVVLAGFFVGVARGEAFGGTDVVCASDG